MSDVARTRVRPPTPRRLGIVVALVASLMLTLVARLYYVELLDPNKPVQSAHQLHDGVIVVPAPRGLIVDANGVPLVANTSARVITVTRDLQRQLPDKGRAALTRLARLLHTSPATLMRETTPCAPKVPQPCSTDEPFAPVTVATHVPTSVVLAISEHAELYPGVQVQTVTLPVYPGGTLAAHLLGYTADVTAADTKANPALHASDSIGAAGLEAQYDAALRGVDGRQIVQLNPQGYTVRGGGSVAPLQGDTLVTSIDAKVQALAEKSLAQQIRDSRKKGNPAPSGSVVVLDPQTGRVIAAASYPTYDPSLFTGGISDADYRRLTDPAANTPLLNRATAGEYAPGSTFKLITSSSLVMHHQITPTGIYGCPGSVTIDGRVKTNYASEVLGPISLRDALGYSCDTFFYTPTADEFYADQQRLSNHRPALEWLQKMAARYGVGRSPQLDLPPGEQAAGTYADRETRMARWRANKASYCAAAKRGYPEIKNYSDRTYLTRLAAENCTDGWRYRAGDNADMSIGQGETTMSPLQLALAYAALVNGGTVWEPRLGWAVVDAHGKVVRTIKAVARDLVPVSQSLLNFIARSLDFSRGWAVSGAFAYIGSPYQNRIGGKTGTAEVFGKKDTSWLATWGPTYHDRKGNIRAHYVVVGMVEQAGTGATAAGPMLKRIWDGLLGAHGKPIVPGSRPATTLPHIAPQVKVTR